MPGPYRCIRLITRSWKTDCTACHPRKTTTYILHVVSTTTHTHDRRKSIGKKKQRKEKKIKERKEGVSQPRLSFVPGMFFCSIIISLIVIRSDSVSRERLFSTGFSRACFLSSVESSSLFLCSLWRRLV